MLVYVTYYYFCVLLKCDSYKILAMLCNVFTVATSIDIGSSPNKKRVSDMGLISIMIYVSNSTALLGSQRLPNNL